MNVDGGLSVNGYFRQFLADISGKTIISPVNKEITAFGVAMLARKGLGNDQEIKLEQKVETTEPRNIDRKNILNKYKEIIARSRGLRE